MLSEAELNELLIELGTHRRLAHDVLFKHRHPLTTPAFHYHIIDAFHGDHPQVVVEAFRDAAKSTVAEEAVVIRALYREFRNGVIIGASYERAKERLTAIKNEFVVNEYINGMFGNMEGPTWGEGRIVLSNGVCIQALGCGMSMRGVKYLDARPDFALIDDLEDEETVRTPEAREQMMHWLYRTFMPALAKTRKVRFLGNRLDGDAVIVKISKDPAWRHYRFPIMTMDEEGQWTEGLPDGRWTALWPEKYNIDEIGVKRSEYERQGLLHDFNCEYMCEADDPAAKLFHEGMARTVPQVRTWEAVYAAYDPARTTNRQSASTGKAVFSWIRNKLVVWEGDAKMWLPDQMIDDMFETDDRWTPTELGVEATGLEEFIMQPLRHRAMLRRQLLPLRRLVPPRGKDSFIKGLQPFFKAGEVEFVDVSQEARGQLTSFPSGRKDFPNALAYALMMRPGLPVYDSFGREHVTEQPVKYRQPYWLAVNATSQYTAAVLLQMVDGGIRVHADWLREGPPGETLKDLVAAANLEGGGKVRLIAPPLGTFSVDTVGLRVAAAGIPVTVRGGGDPVKGREALRSLMGLRKRDEPQLLVGYGARWTVNALASGFAYAVLRGGQLTREPVDGPYRVLMEGLESFVAAMGFVDDTGEHEARYTTDDGGRRYKTILARGETYGQELKKG